MLRQIVHLDLTAFFVSVERARDRTLRGRPVIVGGKPDARGVVAAASAEAREHGVTSGMPLSEAAARCPDAVFLEGALERYREASDAVDAIVRRWTSHIEWISIDEAFVDLSGTTVTHGHPRQTTERIHERILDELSLDVAAGIATSRVVAAVASRLARPRGLLDVLPAYERRFLAPLAIELLPDITPAAATRLRAAAVTTIGDLAALDSRRAMELLGAAGAVLARRAAACDPTPVRARRRVSPQLSLLPLLLDRRGRYARGA